MVLAVEVFVTLGDEVDGVVEVVVILVVVVVLGVVEGLVKTVVACDNFLFNLSRTIVSSNGNSILSSSSHSRFEDVFSNKCVVIPGDEVVGV